MSEEMKSDSTQVNQENMVENKQETSSDSSLLHEVMQKKEKIKALEAEIAKRDAASDQRRTKKMEEDGKLKELLGEKDLTIERQNSKIESQSEIVSYFTESLVSELAGTDKERYEHLQTKPIELLIELKKEKLAMQSNSVANPKESLGAVRSPLLNKNYADMTTNERKAWHEQVFNRKK